jgi:hypothetical protein
MITGTPMNRIVRRAALITSMAGGTVIADAAGAPWKAVYSADLPTYAANLRADGFPAEVIGLLVSQELNRRFADRERALQPTTLTVDGLRNFWSLERRAESRLLRVEKQMLARAVLETAPGTTAETDWVGKTLAALRSADRDAVRAIADDYEDLIQRIRDASRGFLTTEDRDAITYLEDERLRDLAAVLSPEQLVDFQIRDTAVGRIVLDDLSCFEPTPQELRDYYEQMVAHGGDRIALELESPGAMYRQVVARRQVVAALAERWPPERHVRLRFALFQPYRKIYALAHRLGLTTTDANAVLAALRELMDGIAAIDARRQIPFDSSARQAEVIDLYERQCAAVRAILGEDGFKEYHEVFSETFSWNEVGQIGWLNLDF